MKIAVIDSGIHAGHAHVGRVAGGVSFAGPDFDDRLGHGTAVAGAIREKCPCADLYAVKVFDRRLSTTIENLLRALEWSMRNAMDVINLSLGTDNARHREPFERVIARGALLVSAADRLPGNLPGVIGVAADAACPRDAYRFHDGIFYASPYPQPIPGVPVERNLNGSSFAVANLTGFLARLDGCPKPQWRDALIAGAS